MPKLKKSAILAHLKKSATKPLTEPRQSRPTSPQPISVHNTWLRSQIKQISVWIHGSQRQHFGPKVRIPDLFQRSDQIYFALESRQLRWNPPAPVYCHDLLDAATKVGHVEERIGYIFKNKMTCIEALKVTGNISPLHYKGLVETMGCNNRLALLGDRILSLALCEIWFHTGNTTGDYSEMVLKTETRAALDVKGRSLNVHQNLLLAIGSLGPTNNHVAEALEAILGAVYLDSGHSVQTVKDVIQRIKLDDHEFLQHMEKQPDDTQVQKEHTLLFPNEEQQQKNDTLLAQVHLQTEQQEEANTTANKTTKQIIQAPVPSARAVMEAKENPISWQLSPPPSFQPAKLQTTPIVQNRSLRSFLPWTLVQTWLRRQLSDTQAKEKTLKRPKEGAEDKRPYANRKNAPRHSVVKRPKRSSLTLLQIKSRKRAPAKKLSIQKGKLKAEISLGDTISSQPTIPKRGTKATLNVTLGDSCSDLSANQQEKLNPEVNDKAWASAVAKAATLRKQGKPADVELLYKIRIDEAGFREIALRKKALAETERKEKQEHDQKKSRSKSTVQPTEQNSPPKVASDTGGDLGHSKGDYQSQASTITPPEMAVDTVSSSEVGSTTTRKLVSSVLALQTSQKFDHQSDQSQRQEASAMKQLEQVIVESHQEVWKEAKKTSRKPSLPSRKTTPVVSREQSAAQPQAIVKELARNEPRLKTPDVATPKSRLQNELDKLGNGEAQESVIEPPLYESGMDKFIAGISGDDIVEQDLDGKIDGSQMGQGSVAKPEPLPFSLDQPSTTQLRI